VITFAGDRSCKAWAGVLLLAARTAAMLPAAAAQLCMLMFVCCVLWLGYCHVHCSVHCAVLLAFLRLWVSPACFPEHVVHGCLPPPHGLRDMRAVHCTGCDVASYLSQLRPISFLSVPCVPALQWRVQCCTAALRCSYVGGLGGNLGEAPAAIHRPAVTLVCT
jgi:hypothetical protein